jgi:hypothetical protein
MITRFVVAFTTVVVMTTGQARAQTCRDTTYLGFDTRLTASVVVGGVPFSTSPAASFEVSRGLPLIAQGTNLVTMVGGKLAMVDLKLPLRSILVDDKGAISLQAADALYRLGENAPTLVEKVSSGRLYRSNTATLLQATQAATAAHFSVVREDGGTLKLAALPGALRVASWNAEGLATIVGMSLFAWRGGDTDLLRLATDEGLARARDLVSVGPSRVVVALDESIVLLTPQGRLVIGAIQGRVRWQSGVLYVFDERTGIVWSLAGLGEVGVRLVDEAYAKALIDALPPEAALIHSAFLEAARILGCEPAEALHRRHLENQPKQ